MQKWPTCKNGPLTYPLVWFNFPDADLRINWDFGRFRQILADSGDNFFTGQGAVQWGIVKSAVANRAYRGEMKWI